MRDMEIGRSRFSGKWRHPCADVFVMLRHHDTEDDSPDTGEEEDEADALQRCLEPMLHMWTIAGPDAVLGKVYQHLSKQALVNAALHLGAWDPSIRHLFLERGRTVDPMFFILACTASNAAVQFCVEVLEGSNIGRFQIQGAHHAMNWFTQRCYTPSPGLVGMCRRIAEAVSHACSGEMANWRGTGCGHWRIEISRAYVGKAVMHITELLNESGLSCQPHLMEQHMAMLSYAVIPWHRALWTCATETVKQLTAIAQMLLRLAKVSDHKVFVAAAVRFQQKMQRHSNPCSDVSISEEASRPRAEMSWKRGWPTDAAAEGLLLCVPDLVHTWVASQPQSLLRRLVASHRTDFRSELAADVAVIGDIIPSAENEIMNAGWADPSLLKGMCNTKRPAYCVGTLLAGSRVGIRQRHLAAQTLSNWHTEHCTSDVASSSLPRPGSPSLVSIDTVSSVAAASLLAVSTTPRTQKRTDWHSGLNCKTVVELIATHCMREDTQLEPYFTFCQQRLLAFSPMVYTDLEPTAGGVSPDFGSHLFDIVGDVSDPSENLLSWLDD